MTTFLATPMILDRYGRASSSRSSNTTPNKVIDNGKEFTDPKEIADSFKKYFATVGEQLATKIPIVEKSPLDYIDRHISERFYIFPTTSIEIENEISALNSSKATGPYSIPMNLLKVLKHMISKPLEILFNVSFSCAIVPSNLKIARVIPVLKKEQPTSLNNYSTISLLSVFNKLLE